MCYVWKIQHSLEWAHVQSGWERDAGLSRATTPTWREKSRGNCHSFSCRYSFFSYSWCHVKSKLITLDLQRQPQQTALFMGEIPWRVSERDFIHHVATLCARLESCICSVWWAAACAELAGQEHRQHRASGTPCPGAATERLCGAEGCSPLKGDNGNPPQFCWRK